MALLQTLKHHVVSQGPRLASIPIKWVPFVLQRPVLELALNQLFSEAIHEGELDFLQERRVTLQVQDIAGNWMITYRNGKLCVAEKGQASDVCFSGHLNDFIVMMGRREDPDTLFFQRRLVIEGDTQLGLEIKNLLDNIDYDELPKPVHQLIALASGWVMQQQAALI
ncbi:ubiquinone anaerobic biosynthesis accessory factor UbiT [Celerinatantimonas yamalensis]|uniref:Ubiquinone biosynthesis accessory factor UbiT n=1 Tax=Celerinatantimonas yamalensis TaxID=559956 RepID=A0ABW9G6G1_9GAMM